MAANDTQSEQKSLPPSEKKLRDARKKAQVSSSRDLISGFGLLAMIAYLLIVWPTLRDHVLELVNLVSRVSAEPFTQASAQAIEASANLITIAVLPAIACLVFASVVAGMVGTYGPVFSFDPVKPNFEHINPAAGLKRIFSARNAVEFAKGALKVAILGGVFFLVLRSWIEPMFHVPNCGESCLVPLLVSALMPIAAVAALSFIMIGFVDMRLQRWLFLRDMRMTKTEHKRERKDIEGDPLILNERRRQRQRQGLLVGRLGLPAASVVVVGPDHLAGIRYHRIKAPVPVIVVKARGERAQTMRGEAYKLGIPISENEALAAALAERHAQGDYLRQQHFAAVAQVLIEQGLG